MIFTIRQARTYAGLTQDEVAKKLGMSHVTYIKIEHHTNAFKPSMASKFAKIVNLPKGGVISFYKKDTRNN